ncbi:SAM-dependent methyltransferase [Lysobacteraceae bacterium NML120232]|nr:SAM-dependent methyltransferase [Xanthomonadaceae bacterium NML08-0793]PJK13026.1 SAM-dependent methyltransferase [Xanthomonadaceae bacterium NML120232]
MSTEIRFDDGAAYAQYMGAWSQIIGGQFLHWLNLPTQLDWLDVGCGNGAFTEQIHAQMQPRQLAGIDPAPAQLDYARSRPALARAILLEGDAMALPFADDSFDVAVMPLVIFFVPEPARGVAEMVRVVRQGGLVCAYAWDMYGGGFPYTLLAEALREVGQPAPAPPSVSASRPEVLHALWQTAGLTDIALRRFDARRSFASFDDWWHIATLRSSTRERLARLDAATRRTLQARMRERLVEFTDAHGQLHLPAHAHAIRGRVALS